MKKHYNIPIFITHSGCKNDCVFCNQKIITGRSKSAGEEEIRRTIEEFIGIISRIDNSSVGTEIAFFGGSFTGLDKFEMIRFLELANEYIDKYDFINGVRISTRPDYISREIIGILLKYRVKSIELGVQSMFGEVLAACKRGHTAEDTIKACELIKSAGINLTGQMMLALPESDRGKDIETAKKLVELGINSARIYPAIVLQGTQLYTMYKQNEYAPIDLYEAVFRAKEIKKIFDSNNIKVLRMGLCSSDNININVSGGECIGPYHPAFGELVESEVIYDGLAEEFAKLKTENKNSEKIEIIIETAGANMSKIVGHGRKNISRLRERFPEFKSIKIIEKNKINENNENNENNSFFELFVTKKVYNIIVK